MKVVGIIAEYNPFHNGHKYHLEKALKKTGASVSVAVMSGNFLQRGEPALWDKRHRAKMAVENGVSLVVELPFAFACNNAEQFAYGGVSLLSGLGCVTDLAFGCEGEPEALMRTALQISREDDELKRSLAFYLEKGQSYPAARTAALRACGEEEGAALLTLPNNILAAEYLKQCILQNSGMGIAAVKRMGGGYLDTDLSHSLSSAAAIRDAWEKGASLEELQAFLPPETVTVLKDLDPRDNVFFRDFYELAVYRIRSAGKEELAEIYAVSEGLENLLKKAAASAVDLESLIRGVKSRRYTRTRIQRILIQAVMGLAKTEYNQILEDRQLYAHVLAFDEKGAGLLRHIKKSGCASIPVYSNISKETSEKERQSALLRYDLLATDVYHIVQRNGIYSGSDLVLAPYCKKY